MVLKVYLYDENGSFKEIELDDTELMFYDIVLATLNSTLSISNSAYDYFEYFDEDDETIAVRTDDELESFLAFAKERDRDEPIRIQLKVNKPEKTEKIDEFDSLNPNRIKPEELHLLERLADGQFGTVYKALNIKNDQLLAVKSIAIDNAINTRIQLLNEIEILKLACKSPYIVKFYSAIFVDNELLICLELMDGLSLDRYGQLPPPVLGAVTVAIVNGLSYLWSKNIIHRDIKPSNFLVNKQGTVKLADFGVSKQMAKSVAYSYVGTKVYMAPERIGGDMYKIHSDIWSLGVSLVEMAMGEFPFVDSLNLPESNNFGSNLIDAIMGNRLNKFLNTEAICKIGQKFDVLVSGCLKHKPLDRIQPKEIIASEFYQKNSPQDNKLIASFIQERMESLKH